MIPISWAFFLGSSWFMKTALLILDMLNTLEFAEGRTLAKRALPVARNILNLKKRCQKHKIPVIYVNDNFGQWQSDWQGIFALCSHEKSLGKEMAEIIHPDPDDYFVPKAKHSGFYSTHLDPLLQDLKVQRLIITGIAGNICVLFTAHDAHMREYKILVPKDCVASNSKKDDNFLLHQLQHTLKFPVTESGRIRF